MKRYVLFALASAILFTSAPSRAADESGSDAAANHHDDLRRLLGEARMFATQNDPDAAVEAIRRAEALGLKEDREMAAQLPAVYSMIDEARERLQNNAPHGQPRHEAEPVTAQSERITKLRCRTTHLEFGIVYPSGMTRALRTPSPGDPVEITVNRDDNTVTFISYDSVSGTWPVESPPEALLPLGRRGNKEALRSLATVFAGKRTERLEQTFSLDTSTFTFKSFRREAWPQGEMLYLVDGQCDPGPAERLLDPRVAEIILRRPRARPVRHGSAADAGKRK
jgi:hypothetical protein